MRRRSRVATKVVLAVACVIGALTAMGEPWYGPAPPPPAKADVTLTLPFEELAGDLSRWLREPEGTTAWQAFDRVDSVLGGLLVIAGLAAACCLSPAVERPARSLLAACSLASVVLVLVKLVDHPGANGASEPRYGLFMAAAFVALLLAFTSGILAAPLEGAARTAARRARATRV